MTALAKLNFKSVTRSTLRDPVLARRDKLIAGLKEQQLVFAAALKGEDHRVECGFRRIRPPIPITSGHLFRSIRPPVTRCREAVDFGYQVWGFSSSFLAIVFRMDAPSSSMRYAL